MKIFKYAIAILILGVGFSACQKDLLEEKPTNVLVASQFFQSAADAEIALNGAYNSLQNDWTFDFVGAPVHWGNKGVDELNTPNWAAGGRKELQLYQITSNMVAIENLWQGHFESINVVNGVVDRVAAMSDELIDSERRAEIIAEAKFIRAILYFSAVKIWENVPLITSETTSLNDIEVSQATPDAVYAQIISDLQEAESVLEQGQGGGRATQGAAATLLGKVYLQMTGHPLNQTDKFAMAVEQFEKVISSGVYSLQPTYSAVFDYLNEDNSETIFAVKFDGPAMNDDGSSVGSYMGPNGSQANGGGWGTEYINQDLVASYDGNDDRLCHNVAKHNVNNCNTNFCEDASCDIGACGYRPWKWHKPKPNTFLYDSPIDFILLRYADVLLSYAEALNKLEGGPSANAYDAVNQVTSRSNAPAMADGLDASAFADALLMERRRELCFEGHRKDDLIRFGKFKDVIMSVNESCWSSSGNPGDNFEDHEIRFPIPQRELDLNSNLKQNTGYE
ncbi:MAG: RagB/SusD family nutrient uptake outer membrane protein [Bacteroidota bacterium]